MFIIVYRLMTGWVLASACLHVQRLVAHAVRMQLSIDDSNLFLCRFNQYSSRCITEEWTGGTVVVVGNTRHLVACQQDNLLILTCFDQTVANLQSINKTGAGNLHVKTKSVFYVVVFSYD